MRIQMSSASILYFAYVPISCNRPLVAAGVGFTYEGGTNDEASNCICGLAVAMLLVLLAVSLGLLLHAAAVMVITRTC